MRRWEIVVGIAIYLIVLAGTLTYMQGQIDESEQRITQNAVRNAAQDEVRRQLLAALRRADMQACLRDEALKAEFRRQAVENFERLAQTADLLHLELTPELRREAAAGRDRTLARFAAREC